MQEVKVWLLIRGDYCAWHAVAIHVVFDITNNIQLGGKSLKELEDWCENDSISDYKLTTAILHKGKYYIKTEHV